MRKASVRGTPGPEEGTPLAYETHGETKTVATMSTTFTATKQIYDSPEEHARRNLTSLHTTQEGRCGRPKMAARGGRTDSSSPVG
jgi:hypothetical protein